MAGRPCRLRLARGFHRRSRAMHRRTCQIIGLRMRSWDTITVVAVVAPAVIKVVVVGTRVVEEGAGIIIMVEGGVEEAIMVEVDIMAAKDRAGTGTTITTGTSITRGGISLP